MVLETDRFVLGAERHFWHKETMTNATQHMAAFAWAYRQSGSKA
ncbi:hypothetical protein [Methylobacterium marchantiae]|uniref:Uncharacterized protein n=1 Tax=Methylobacterium marchantiae TaxID=600331 RepID=A0ABW3X2Q6_9HYPH|nr:hypothetical protein AIGOOFII_4243 [Methylobacterium marchantiae]